MIKYPDKTRQEALETYQREGIKVACERYHVPSSTIYRWVTIEKREAMLARAAREDGDDPTAALPEEERKTDQPMASEQVEKSAQEESTAIEEDVLDMVTLLTAENEKLRAMNLQLRKALQAFVM